MTNKLTIEQIEERLSALVSERGELRAAGADAEALEENRLRIVGVQCELADALIDRFLPAA